MDLIEKVKNTVAEYLNVADLKTGVLTGSYTDTNPDFLRCFLWKAVFLLESLNPEEWPTSFEASRATYKFLSLEYKPPFSDLKPDNPYYEEPKFNLTQRFQETSPKQAPMKKSLFKAKKTKKKSISSETHDSPLSGPSQDLNELNTIIIDIERTFPGHPLFQDIDVKRDIVKILFIWYKLNQDIGYRQGMHEIAALIYMVVRAESFEKPTNGFRGEDSRIFAIFDAGAILADVFHMFTIFMINPQSLYYNEDHLLANCAEFDTTLSMLDPDIYHYLHDLLQLESQIWLIRWLRLMLIRELTVLTVLPIWDRLISFQKIRNFSNLTSNADFNTIMIIVVALLVMKIKKQIFLDCLDYGDVLKLFLNYPVTTVFDNATLSKKFDDDFDLAEEGAPESVIGIITELFNEAVLVFNSRRNLSSIGRFLNEKYNKELINLYESKGGVPGESLDQDILHSIRFERHLQKRVRGALK